MKTPLYLLFLTATTVLADGPKDNRVTQPENEMGL